MVPPCSGSFTNETGRLIKKRCTGPVLPVDSARGEDGGSKSYLDLDYDEFERGGPSTSTSK